MPETTTYTKEALSSNSKTKEARPKHGTQGEFDVGRFDVARFDSPDEVLPREARPSTTYTKEARPASA